MYLGACPRLRQAALASHRSFASVVKPSASARSLNSILIANRGEIALLVGPTPPLDNALTENRRVGRTASEYGIKTTVVYTDPDAKSQHASSSPFSIRLGNSSAYLDGEKIIQIAQEQGCTAIHPGYGFVRLLFCVRQPKPLTLSSSARTRALRGNASKLVSFSSALHGKPWKPWEIRGMRSCRDI